jgi:hypothetical protein
VKKEQEKWRQQHERALFVLEKEPFALLAPYPWWLIGLGCAGIGAGLGVVAFFVFPPKPPVKCADCGALLPKDMIPLVVPWICDRCQRERLKIPFQETKRRAGRRRGGGSSSDVSDEDIPF